MFDVKGFTTSLGSREYLALSKPATETAPAIQKLIDQGAENVGLSKMCSMILLQHPPHCVNFAAPFSPRGDGYQSPSGGNSGQAAAIAAYEWLDIAVGTDCKALISVYLVFPASTTQFDMRLVMTRLLTSFFSNSKRPSFSSSQWRIFPSSFSRSSFVSRHVVRCAVGRGSIHKQIYFGFELTLPKFRKDRQIHLVSSEGTSLHLRASQGHGTNPTAESCLTPSSTFPTFCQKQQRARKLSFRGS